MTNHIDALPQRTATLRDQVFEAIRSAIVAKQLPPGSRVTEQMLAKRLEVSKTPVRESLQQLELIGLLEADDRGRLHVVVPSAATIRDAYNVRIGLEAQAARLCAQTRTERADEIMVLAHATVEATRTGDFAVADRRFHWAVAAASANARLDRLVHNAIELTSALRSRDTMPGHDSLRCAQQHIGVAQAICDGDGEAAAASMLDHITSVRNIVVKEFGIKTGDRIKIPTAAAHSRP